MTRLALLFAVLALALVTASPASAHYRPVGKDCGSIAFTPQTDEGASAIRAKNVKCSTARRIVRAVRRGNNSPLDFTCRSRDHDPRRGLAHTDVVCTRANRRVSWAAY
jgi:hypothetical protein